MLDVHQKGALSRSSFRPIRVMWFITAAYKRSQPISVEVGWELLMTSPFELTKVN